MRHLAALSPQRLGLLIAVGAAISFGMWPVAARAVYAHGGNAVLVMMASMAVRAMVMAAFCRATRRPLFATRAVVKEAFSGGIPQAIAVITIYKSVEYLPGPIAIIIIFSHTLMLLFYMAWRGEIKLDKATVATTVIALIGLSLVVDLWHTQTGAQWLGIILAFIAAVSTVSRLYAFGRQTRERHPIIVGAENFIAATILMLPVMFFEAPHLPQSAAGYGWLATGITSSVLGTFCQFYGISLLGSFRYSLFLKLEPVFTALFAATLIREILQPQQYVGMLVVLAALAFYQIFEHRKKSTRLDKDVLG